MEQHDYTNDIADHYAAYRPPLHVLILKKVLPDDIYVEAGLDIGCGTGQSAIALTNFCKQVIGLEPSQEMLAAAIGHPAVQYVHKAHEHLDFSDNAFDIVTYAGSLFYAKSQHILDETIRVLRPQGFVIIYDFEIHLDTVLRMCGAEVPEKRESIYNHLVNFSGLETGKLSMKIAKTEAYTLELQTQELVHLLLADKGNYECLAATFGAADLMKNVTQALTKIAGDDDRHQIPSSLYYTRYTL